MCEHSRATPKIYIPNDKNANGVNNCLPTPFLNYALLCLLLFICWSQSSNSGLQTLKRSNVLWIKYNLLSFCFLNSFTKSGDSVLAFRDVHR